MRKVPDGYGVAKLQPNSRRIQGKCRKCRGLSALQKLVSVGPLGNRGESGGRQCGPHIQEVVGSSPAPPTIEFKSRKALRAGKMRQEGDSGRFANGLLTFAPRINFSSPRGQTP